MKIFKHINKKLKFKSTKDLHLDFNKNIQKKVMIKMKMKTQLIMIHL